MPNISLSEALVELPKAEAVIVNVAVVKKRLSKMAKDLRDEIFEEARKAYKKKKLELELSMKMELKRAADEASVALKTAKKLRTIVYEPEGYESRTKLTDVLWILAKNGYAKEADDCAGLNRETWMYLPPEMSEEDKDRVRKTNMFWQAIINLKHGKWKMTRLVCLAAAGKLSRVRELCDWRAGVNEADKYGHTPLWLASSNEHIAVMRELLARGANVDAANNEGATSLYIASQHGRLTVVRELLAAGANIEAANNEGETSLFVASYGGDVDVVRELLAAGANIEAANNYGVTSLFVASRSNLVDVVRELLARGANIEAALDNGATSLYIASYGGHVDVVRELLARGANVEAARNNGATPLIIASWAGHADVVRALLAAGANKHHIRNDGATAVSLAGRSAGVKPKAKAAVLALLAAAP